MFLFTIPVPILKYVSDLSWPGITNHSFMDSTKECTHVNLYIPEVAIRLINLKWVTREKAKVDRIACPWLISKFVDKEAVFLFVPKDKVLETAKKENAIPFDFPGVELMHFEENGKEYVSFDSIIKKYNIKDQALSEVAKIVRGADASIPDAPAESSGLEAAALGFRAIAKDDFENMKLQFPLYDALYAYCKERIEHGAKLEHSSK